MNFDTILALSASVIILFISFRVLLLDTKRKQYRVFFILGILLSWMSFGWYEMGQTDHLATAVFWRKAQAVWTFITPLVIYMVYVFADDQTRQRLPKWAWYTVFISLFGLAFYFYYIELFSHDKHGQMTLLDSGRWSLKIEPEGIHFYLRAIWTALCYFSALGIMFFTYRVEKIRRRRNWKLVIVIFLGLGGIGSIIQNYILPFYGAMMPINESINTLFTTFLFGWAMSDFKLLDYYADPSFEELAKPMPDLIILTSKRWNIQNLNPAAMRFFEQVDYTQAMKVWELLPTDVSEQVKQKMQAGVQNFDLRLTAPDGSLRCYHFTNSLVI